MKLIRLVSLPCLLVAVAAAAPSAGSVGSGAVSAARAEWRRQVDGFEASVVITPDGSWRERRGTPTRDVAKVKRTDAVKIGGKVWALLFLKNPRLDADGNADVTCDLRMIRPNGRVSEHRGLRALRRKVDGAATGTYLSEFVLTMVGEETDPVGEWVLELTVHDHNRGVEVPVVGRYELLPKNARR